MTADVDLVLLSGASFRATEEADRQSDMLREQLGFGANYVPARLALGRSLAVGDPPPAAQGEPGRAIRGETLFGSRDDLATWASLMIEHGGQTPAGLKAWQALITAHWVRGMQLLANAWDASGRSTTRFYLALAEGAGLPLDAPPTSLPIDAEARPFTVPIGPVSTDATTGEAVAWPANAAGASPHAAVMGGVNSGKTRTAVHMLRAMRETAPFALVAFDFKGDMTDKDNALDRAFGATVLQPPGDPIPLDVLALADRAPNAIALAAQRLRDSLATLRGGGFGARQKDALAAAAEAALRTKVPCSLADIRDALKAEYARRGMTEDGAVGTLNDLCRVPLFTPDLAPAEFFARSWVIRLPQDLPEQVRVSIVTLVTDALDRWLNTLADAPTDADGNRSLRIACVIDEAHRVLGTKLPGLSGLIRLSRSKGGAVMLISQKPDDFDGEDDDFLAEMGLVVAFGTNAKPGAVARILGRGADLARLGRGECWIKLRTTDPRRIIAWR